MFRRFFRHIKEGFVGIGRHFSMALSSIASVTITLLLVGVFLMLVVNLNELTKEVEDSISLSALIEFGSDEKSSLSQIEKQITRIDGVNSVEYNSKDDEFDYYINQYPDLIEFYELYREDNPFHDAYIVKLSDASKLDVVKAEIEKINGVASVHDGGSNTYLLVDALGKVRLFGGVLVLSLILLATYLIYNTIHITIEARQTEIWIMRNVGARNGYIRAPFLVEGILIGIIGSILPIASMVFGYLYVLDVSGGVLLGVFSLVKADPFLLYLGLTLLGIGVFVGLVGSWFSVTKSLRKTR